MLTIALPPELEARLQGEASRQGVAAEDYVRRLIADHLPLSVDAPRLADLFSTWEAEDASSDPAESERRNQEVEEFKKAINQNRIEMEGPGSRKPFP